MEVFAATVDQVWGGIIGALGLEEGNESADFYAAFYNDHVSEHEHSVGNLPRRARKPLETSLFGVDTLLVDYQERYESRCNGVCACGDERRVRVGGNSHLLQAFLTCVRWLPRALGWGAITPWTSVLGL